MGGFLALSAAALFSCNSLTFRGPVRADEPAATEITFAGHGGLELSGTLLLPPGATPATPRPAVLLLPGSGPTDRNGNQLPMMRTDLHEQIAERLANEGIATLRFDKRAVMRYRTSWPTDPAAVADYFALRPFVEDAKCAFAFLRDHEATIDDRVAILGHSEGGLIALSIAHDLEAESGRPAGLMLLGTAGRTMDHLVREQVGRSLDQPQVPEDVRTLYRDALEKAIAEVRDEGTLTSEVPQGLRGLFNPSAISILHDYFTVDPAALAAKVRGPVLVLNGAHDVQVLADKDAPRLHEALSAREGSWPCDLVIVPDASHNLKAAPSLDSPGFTGPIVDEAIDAVVQWARLHLTARRPAGG